MAAQFNKGAIALIERPVLGNLATVGSDGHPHVTPVWIDHDGDDVIFNTAEGRVKAKDVHRNPKVAMSIVAPEDPYLVVAFQGTVVDITTDGADAHIDALAKKYLGLDEYPLRTDGEVRIKVRIRPDRVVTQPAQ
ncbi:MAG TPA: PPOX class F420-dependent oxidoreductase [Acidimicrobiales bacterium]|nr:PPOX class F420-dependent oxidoreductase [Acidimicrobiales bacterium]